MKLSNVIKCSICHEMAGLRYNENRVYQSRCQNMACRETVTVTAPSGKAAEELFSKFEKGTIQPKLSIPKKIAEHDWMKHLIECSNLSQFEFECYDDWLSKDDEQFLEWVKTDKNENILYIYLASKALGVELVEVEG